MRILLLSTSYNSLTQRAHVELAQLGHEVSIELALAASVMREAVELFQPDLILCPMLMQIIPEDIWRNHTCLIVHPGIRGDRGPAALDWAILGEQEEWGVTVLQAAEQVDAGAIWASVNFKMRAGSKSSLYRDEVAAAAIEAMLMAVRRFESGLFVPEPLDYSRDNVKGRFRPCMPQSLRQIDWNNDTVETILRKINSADSNPGLLDSIEGESYYLYGAHAEGGLIGPPGEIIGQRHGAICRAAVDGAVWISHLKKRGTSPDEFFKLPAAQVLGDTLAEVPELPIELLYDSDVKTFKEIWYEEVNSVGYLYFEFYNGAMSTDQCERLRQAFIEACKRPTRVIVLMGGRDFWSNGIHLNVIEAAESPADESWRNINAIDDLVHSILTTSHHQVIAAMHGSAGAGGVMLALAADKVFAREGIVLNPHYQSMGGLYGSEYWTYTLPKWVGPDRAQALTEQCLPVGASQAKAMGLVDDVIYRDSYCTDTFRQQVGRIAERLAHAADFDQQLAEKNRRRRQDEAAQPLAQYRTRELARMQENFYGDDPAYHVARANFVRKIQPSQTPLHLARHRQNDWQGVAPEPATARKLAKELILDYGEVAGDGAGS